MQQTAVPDSPPVVAWDPGRGVFLIEGNPEWTAVRARRQALASGPAPIVRPSPRRSWPDRLRRARRDLVLAWQTFWGRA